MKKTSTINKISVLLKGQLKFPKGRGGGGGGSKADNTVYLNHNSEYRQA